MTTFKINGIDVTVEAPGDTPLLWVIRDELRLTGTKYGCGIAQCGACTVVIDGVASRSCITPVETVDGSEIETVEALAGREADAVRQAWAAIDVPQCGWCQSGQVVSATSLLRETARPSDEDIDAAMSGNLCRCATYVQIRKAIHHAAESMEG